MATRSLTLITKNSNTAGKSLPSASSIQVGEALVNTADGKLFYKGSGGNNYVGSNNNTNYFEVGSNLYDLKIENKIINYGGQSDLSGLILSGTPNGFSAVDSSVIQNDIDSYLTGASFDNSSETLTLELNQGRPDVSVTLNDNVTTGGTLIGSSIYFDTKDQLSAYTVDLSSLDTNDTYVTGGTYDNNNEQLTFTNNDGDSFNVDLSSIDINDTYVSGVTFDSTNDTLTLSRTDGASDISTTINDFNSLTADSISGGTISATTFYGDGSNLTGIDDTYVTGGTYDNSNEEITLDRNDGNSVTIDLSTLDLNDTYTTGATLNNSTLVFDTTDQQSAYTADLSSLDSSDTYVTSTSYNSNTNTLTLTRNDSTTIDQTIGGFNNINITGLTVDGITTNLTSGRVVYVDSNNELSTDSNFTFNDTTDKLSVTTFEATDSASVGTGGLEVGSGGGPNSQGDGDVVIHGNLTIYGETVTAATSELYVEDNNIILNYNPNNDTYSTSLNSGISIQDGLGVQGLTGDTVFFEIGQTGATPTDRQDAYDKRFWETDLRNLMLESTGGTGTGHFVVKEEDTIDGGSY